LNTPVSTGVTTPKPILTPRQRLIWVEETLGHGIPLNNVVTWLKIRGHLDMSAMAKAFDLFVARHDALWMTLPGKKGYALRPLPPSQVCRLELVELDGVGDPASFDRWVSERARRTCRPNGPLHDVVLIRRGVDDHVLFVNRHHIVSDGGSSRVMHDELAALYLQCLQEHSGQPAPAALGAAPSYAAYLAEAAAAPVDEASATFWANRQASKPPALRLYGGAAIVSSIHFRRVSLTLDADTSRQIDQLGRPAAISIQLFSAFLAFLRRVTGERDLSVGMPLHNRTEATRAMVGLLMDICPVRVTTRDEDTFADVARKVQAELDEIRPHRRHTTSSHQAGYEVMFNFLPDVPGSFAGYDAHYVHTSPMVLLDDLATADLGEAILHSREKLVVTIQRGSGALCYEVHMDFNRSALPPGMPAERAGAHFLALLQALLKNPDQLIDAVDVTTDDERQRLLGVGSDEAVRATEPRTVVDMFRDRVAAEPDREAVVSANTRWTYRELDHEVETLALALRSAGVGVGSVVAICVERTPMMVVALLAVLRAGAAYLPLDPSNPTERIEFMLDDVTPSLVISERALRERLGARWQGQVICLDALPAAGEPGPAPLPAHQAYVVYTSGSTGRPKGVTITHAQLASFVVAMRDCVGMTAEDRVLASTTIAFDPMIVEVFLPLSIGACVVVVPRAVTIDGRALGRAVREHRITIMQGTPATFRVLLSAGWTGDPGLTVLCGAEVMSTSLAESLLARVGVLWNLYGPTETTVWATAQRVSSQAGQVVPIGTPLEGSRVYVLNHASVPVPIGVSGEIHIGGPRVSQGYHARPELTRERFLADPFSPERAGRMYRTGDFGRLRETLELEFIGRVDNQVKVRGHRVELEEIEAVIAQHEGVTACCVTTFVDASGETALSAHVESAAGPAMCDSQALLASLRRRLPKHMVPARILVVERLPRSPTGKVDRAAVATVERAQPAVVAAGARPSSELEEDLLDIWQDVLKAPHLGVTDDFFDAGGHSLLAVTLLDRIEKRFGVEVDLERIFKTPSVRTLGASLGAKVVSKPVATAAIIKHHAATTLYFLHGRAQFLPIAECLREVIGSASVFPNGPRWLRRLVGDGEPTRATRRIGDAYAQDILNEHRGGEIFLAGHSFGGILAIEAACHLEACGAAPAGVFLFDTVMEHGSRLEHEGSGTQNARIDADNHEWGPALEALRIAGTRTYLGPVRPLSSPVVLLRAKDKTIYKGSAEDEATQGWGQLFGPGQLTVVPVPGDHSTLITADNAGALADAIRRHLGV